MADENREPERELSADEASAALSEALQKRLRGLEAKDATPVVRKRYLLGPFEDPNDGPKVLMSLEAAIEDLRSRFDDAECHSIGDQITYRIVELSDEEVDALPEL